MSSPDGPANDDTPPTPLAGSAPDALARSPEAAAQAARRATLASVGVALVLVSLKAFGWGASGSVSLLASLVDSSLDLIASLGAFFAVRWAAQPADAEHRYGHGKAEVLASLVQAGLVFASAVFIGWEAVVRILDPRPVAGGAISVWVMVAAILITLGLIAYQTRQLRQTGSLAVKGDRAHYTADLASNLVALIGVGSAAFMGAAPLDAVAGLIVAVWLFWGALGVLREAADHLMDRALPDEVNARIAALVSEDARIRGVHRLRTRASGERWMIEMHADLDARLTLAKVHAILEEAEARIAAVYPQAEVIIHPDPSAALNRSK